MRVKTREWCYLTRPFTSNPDNIFFFKMCLYFLIETACKGILKCVLAPMYGLHERPITASLSHQNLNLCKISLLQPHVSSSLYNIG